MPPTTSNSVAKFPPIATEESLLPPHLPPHLPPPVPPRTTYKLSFLGTPLPKAETPLTPEETLIFFDWDDTCMASGWLHTNGFKTYDAYGPVLEKYAEMGEALASVVEPLLLHASKLGRVVFVTNANEGWVQLSCAALMPKLLPLISSFSVFSAQDRYKHMTPSPMEWKRRTFQEVVMAIPGPIGKLRNFISIGDGVAEKYAVHALRGNPSALFYRPMNIVKAVKLLEQPTPSVLVEQLVALHQMLESVVHHPSSTDILAELTVTSVLPPLPDSRSDTEEDVVITVADPGAVLAAALVSKIKEEEREFFLGLTEI